MRRPLAILFLLCASIAGRAAPPAPPGPAAAIDAMHAAHLEGRMARLGPTPPADAVTALCRELLRVKPDHPVAMKRLEDELARAGEVAFARMVLVHRALLNPDDAGLVRDAETILNTRRQLREEEEVLPAREAHLKALEKQLLAAAEELRLGRLEACEQGLRMALRDQPSEPAVLRELAGYFSATGEWALCAVVNGYAQRMHPERTEFASSHALSLARIGRNRLAYDRLQRLFAAQPASAFLAENAARQATLLGLHEQAAEHLARLAALQPERPEHWLRYGESLLECGPDKLLAAKIAFRKVLDLDRKSAAAPFYLAAVECQRGNPREAAGWLRQVLPSLGKTSLDDILGQEPFRRHPSLANLLRTTATEEKP